MGWTYILLEGYCGRRWPQKKLKYRFIEILTLESGDPPGPDQFAEVLKGRYQEIGIGIVQDGNKRLWTTLLLAER